MDNCTENIPGDSTNFPTTSATNSGSESKKKNRTKGRRKRLKGFFTSVIQKIESLLVAPKHRRPAWLKELISQKSDKYVPVRFLVERILDEEESRRSVLSSKGFIQLLRQSRLLEVDDQGVHIRAKDTTSKDGIVADSECILYVDNLPGSADDAWLQTIFSHYGRIIDGWVIKPKNKAAVAARKREEEEHKDGKAITPNGHRRNKGFGFVRFAEFSTAKKVLSIFRRRNPVLAQEMKEGMNEKMEKKDGTVEKETEMVIETEAVHSCCRGASTSASDIHSCDQEKCSTLNSSSGKRKLQDDSQQSTSKKPRSAPPAHDLPTPPSHPNGLVENEASTSGKCHEHIPAGTITRTSRKKRTYRKNRRPVQQDSIHHKWEKILHVYSWSEWHRRKRTYLSVQRENVSKLKSDLKKCSGTRSMDSVTGNQSLHPLLRRRDRYKPNGKELRGREKVLLKAESMQRICQDANGEKGAEDEEAKMESAKDT